MEKQDIEEQSEAVKSLKKRYLTSLWEDFRPLVTDVLMLSRHPTLEDALLELSRSEVLFVTLLQALRTKDVLMSGRLMQEVDQWEVLPRLSFYVGHKLHVEFNCPEDFFSSAAEFAHTLHGYGLFTIPDNMLEFLDHLAECMRKDIESRSQRKQEFQNVETCTTPSPRPRTSKSAHQASETSAPCTTLSPSPRTITSSHQMQRSIGEIEEATEALWTAVKNNDSKATRSAIMGGADLERRDSGGRTPLYWAANEGREEVIEVLLSSGADVDAEDGNGNSPLHRAVLKGRDIVVKKLLEAGADVNGRGRNDTTPLHCAARKGYVVAIDMLLRAGADVEVEDSHGNRPLHMAAFLGMDSAVSKLLEAGAEVNAKGMDDQTPLHCAASGGYIMVMELLLMAGANIEATENEGYRPIHLAAFLGKDAALAVLVNAGADVNARGLRNKTALQLAVSEGNFMAMEVLLKAGADTESVDSSGNRPLECSDQLVDTGADVHARGQDNQTILD